MAEETLVTNESIQETDTVEDSWEDESGANEWGPGGQPTATEQINIQKSNQAFHYRYPNAQIEKNTDFLEIKVVEYKPSKFDTNAEDNKNALSLSTAKDVMGGEGGNIEYPKGYIYLPIPQQIQDSNTVNWGDDSINSLAAGAIGVVKNVQEAANLFTGLKEGGSKVEGSLQEVADDLPKVANAYFANRIINVLGGKTTLGGVLARSTGRILNPNKELLFNGVTLRTFQFSFDLAPRDKKEGQTIKNIIRTFKQNMNAKKTGSGLFIESPNVFQLTYKTGSGPHQFLHKFLPTALTQMSVNYTGAGTYATYDDTTPVHMILSLSFQELNPIYNEDYDEGDGATGVGY